MENDNLKQENNNANTLLCTDWREVAKEKPQDKQYVIVYALGGRMLMAYYKNEVFFCYNIASEELEEIEEPTHWMPQPPKPICAVTNKSSSDMEKIDQILESLYDRVIEPLEAKEQLLLLFGVMESDCDHEWINNSFDQFGFLQEQICDKCGAKQSVP